MSNQWIPIHEGEVQVMSAGSGIQHSEMNNHPTSDLKLFQIWIFPNQQNVTPRYDQKKFDILARKNKLQILVSSIDDGHTESLKIHQNAQISRIDLDENSSFQYQLISEINGVYVMLIDGETQIDNMVLNKRDAIGIEQANFFEIFAIKKSEILFIEVPMKF
jgi:hypothetical protein